MLLAVDIGNSNVVFGLYNEGKWQEVWRMGTKDEAQGRLYHLLNKHIKDKEEINGIVISSVVPFFTPIVSKQLEQKFNIKPYIISPDSYSALPLEVLHPRQIGSDLVADAMAGYSKFNSDCMVIDFGTALTFTIVTDKKIKGVNIVPGLKMAMKALAGSTVKLQEIPLQLPSSVIGTDTTTAIQAGILWGYVGLVEGMIKRINSELNKDLKVVATGGLSKVLPPLQEKFDLVEPHLTLEGMRLIYAANKK